MRTKYLVRQNKAKLFKLFKDLAKSRLTFTQMHKYKKKCLIRDISLCMK